MAAVRGRRSEWKKVKGAAGTSGALDLRLAGGDEAGERRKSGIVFLPGCVYNI